MPRSDPTPAGRAVKSQVERLGEGGHDVPPGEGPAIGHHRAMTSSAEISSLSSTLKELHDRVTALAESAVASGDEEIAHELFFVERSLGGALRRLRRFV